MNLSRHRFAQELAEVGTVAADVEVGVDVGVFGQRAVFVDVGALPEQRASEVPVQCRGSVANSRWPEWWARSWDMQVG